MSQRAQLSWRGRGNLFKVPSAGVLGGAKPPKCEAHSSKRGNKNPCPPKTIWGANGGFEKMPIMTSRHIIGSSGRTTEKNTIFK